MLNAFDERLWNILPLKSRVVFECIYFKCVKSVKEMDSVANSNSCRCKIYYYFQRRQTTDMLNCLTRL